MTSYTERIKIYENLARLFLNHGADKISSDELDFIFISLKKLSQGHNSEKKTTTQSCLAGRIISSVLNNSEILEKRYQFVIDATTPSKYKVNFSDSPEDLFYNFSY